MTPENLREKRIAANLTQAALASHLGMERRQIGRYEKDEARIPRLVQIAVDGLLTRRKK
jgi:transcriptional regulator with XRE-family HTH domain